MGRFAAALETMAWVVSYAANSVSSNQRCPMVKITQTLMVLAGLLALSHGTAQATEYPYCLTYTEGWSGAIERCEYATMAQCQASGQGLNGTCAANWRLALNRGQNPDAAEPAAPRKRTRH
ncbi:MAG: DUF3551 domain-containing protein [Afipia sp.]